MSILTLPLTDETRGLFDGEMLSHMKNTAVLINISRGAVVDEDALTAALSEKKLYGAVLDVFESEPLSQDSPLWDMENVVITPHNSFVSEKNSERLFSVIYGKFLRLRFRCRLRDSYWFRRKTERRIISEAT